MIIKSSTALRNDYGTISELAKDSREPIYITKNGEGDLVVMSIDAFERREEILTLRTRLDVAEQLRLSGGQSFSVGESKKRLEEIFRNGKV